MKSIYRYFLRNNIKSDMYHILHTAMRGWGYNYIGSSQEIIQEFSKVLNCECSKCVNNVVDITTTHKWFNL